MSEYAEMELRWTRRRLQNINDFADMQGELIRELKEQNSRYKQALEFYADEDNYDDVEYEDFNSNGELIPRNLDGLIEQDRGEEARQALKEDE